MDCRLCGAPSEIVAKNHHGYQESISFDIFECNKCNTSFVLPVSFSTEIYQHIYKNASTVPGYNRYYYYADEVKKSTSPLTFLASKEPMYWAIKEKLKNFSGKKILEVGSGFGYLTYAIAQQGYDIAGIDISSNAITEAQKKFGNLYECADVFEYYKKHLKEYDLIILTEVIEHLEYPVAFIDCLVKMIKEDGEILITTPNKTAHSGASMWMSDLPPVHLWWFPESAATYIAETLKCDIEFTNFKPFNQNHFIKPRYRFFKDHGYIPPRLNSDGTVKDPAVWEEEKMSPFKRWAQKVFTKITTNALIYPFVARTEYPLKRTATLAFTLKKPGIK